jgi:hypothetical protein
MRSMAVKVSQVAWAMKMSDRSGASLIRALHVPLSATCGKQGGRRQGRGKGGGASNDGRGRGGEGVEGYAH